MRKLGFILAITAMFLLAACGKGASPAVPSPDPGSTPGGTPGAAPGGAKPGGATAGDIPAVYRQNCVTCHGDNLQGMRGPSLQKIGSKYSRDQLIQLISNGRDGMPGFKGRIPDPQIAELADWLAAKK